MLTSSKVWRPAPSTQISKPSTRSHTRFTRPRPSAHNLVFNTDQGQVQAEALTSLILTVRMCVWPGPSTRLHTRFTRPSAHNLVLNTDQGQVQAEALTSLIVTVRMCVRAAGHLDIICLEDIVHEVVTIGPHFKEVNTFLLLFRLNPPAGGWKKRSRLFANGGECGQRGDKINDLLRRMI